MLLLGPNTHTMRTMRALRCARVCLSLLVHEQSVTVQYSTFLQISTAVTCFGYMSVPDLACPVLYCAIPLLSRLL